MKGLEYQTANPGQDFDENETKLFDPERDVDRPMVNVVATGSVSEPSYRPISGDTLSGYKQDATPQDQVKSGNAGPHTQASITRAVRRGSSPLPPINAEAERSVSISDGQRSTNADDIVHGGPHYSRTANGLDPRLQSDTTAMGSYQAGPGTEAAHSARGASDT